MNLSNTTLACLGGHEPPHPEGSPEASPNPEENTPGEGWRVILYNDDFHTMDEVVDQLVLALDCSIDLAAVLMLRAHSTGRSIVAITTRQEADRIAIILRSSGLQVRVEPV
ncbi:MAG: ATP-dependent Clp protease adaptor ClpS [Candidatus Sumerlaeaceae bacterium]|nr:ATP-dependent Clp protease adaptor ClpS [Candidatus Sumerlaeaceae bacterium]